MKDESFGPIIGIQKVRDDGEAVRLMNDTEYGPTGVYTPGESVRRILAQVHAGRRTEPLRPGKPAAALVGCGPLGDWAHAVDLRHPDLHTAEGVAPARNP